MSRSACLLWLTLLPAGCTAADARPTSDPETAAGAYAPGDTSQTAEYWDLPTGSHIAYRHVPAPGEARQPALVFLHGGPGAYIVARFDDSPDWWRQLASLGFDVFAYDQVGSGLSARLKDPTQYTIARHVADL
jgi:proline iminopeptidase